MKLARYTHHGVTSTGLVSAPGAELDSRPPNSGFLCAQHDALSEVYVLAETGRICAGELSMARSCLTWKIRSWKGSGYMSRVFKGKFGGNDLLKSGIFALFSGVETQY